MSQPEPAPGPGVQFLAEIREQPAAIRRLLEHRAEFRDVAARAPGGLVRMVAHGSSDNAASYGVYAFGLLAGRTALRDSISLTVYYGAELDFAGSTVIALSQSGRTPDVLEYLTRARRAGAFTVAVTNDEGSALAEAADALLPLAAGAEHAVAATKTYLNTLAALALLAAELGGRGDEVADGLDWIAGALEQELPLLEREAAAIAVPFASVGRMFAIGRGPEFATALESSPPGEWRVLQSSRGVHVIRLDAATPAHPAEFEDLRGVVLQDWTDATLADQRTAAVRALAKKYTIKAEPAAPGVSFVGPDRRAPAEDADE